MTSSSTADVTTDRLFVGFGSEPPTLEELTVFDELETAVAGHRFRFTVVGCSHYIEAPDAGYYEIVSCRPVEHDRVHELALPDGADSKISFEGNAVGTETTVEVRDIEAFPARRSFDLSYTFEPDAHTTIDLLDGSGGQPAGYETYHTYPEHDCLVYTETRLTE
jgi:hypothetical protein